MLLTFIVNFITTFLILFVLNEITTKIYNFDSSFPQRLMHSIIGSVFISITFSIL